MVDHVGNALALLESGEDAVEHHGIKGMKWGIRRKRGGSSSSDSTPTDVVVKSRPGKIETSGGKNQMPSLDAKIAAGHRQKARASGVHALTNQELQALVTRMNLEAQYAKAVAANAPPKGAGRKFLEKLAKDELNAVMSGKKGHVQPIVEMIIKQQKGRTARKATSKAAQTGAKAIAGVIVNR